MAKTKEQKQEIVSRLERAMKGAPSSVFVHFSGLSVAEESGMRRELRAERVGYTVAKKTLIRRALDSLGYAHDQLPLEGEVALAYGLPAQAGGVDDATAPARLVHQFGGKFGGKLSILGGIFEGEIRGRTQMEEIATIPGMQALRGMFANVINSPIAGLAIALKAIADKQGT